MSGCLAYYDFASLCSTHPLVLHLVKMIVKCHDYNFTWVAYEDPFWKKQLTVPRDHAYAMLAALFHYRMHAPDLMRFLGGTYTGEHRDITATVECLVSHDINPWLITKYVQVMTVGCPTHFFAETNQENSMLY